MNLTDLTVRSLAPGVYYDDKTPAFGIRVGKKRRSWIVVKGRGRVKMTIGHYPALSLSDARKKALVALGSPLELRAAPAFPDAVKTFLAQPRWRPRSLAVLKSSLKHFTWTRPLDKITHQDIAQALDAIPHRSARAHALKDIRAFFNWCVPRYLPSSPCVGFKMPGYKSRDRVLSDDELKRVWSAAESMGVYGKQIHCLIATGQRVGQFIAFDPSWTNGEAITFPATVMKNGADHSIPLGELTSSLLPHLKKTTYQGKPKRELDRLSGVTGWVIHDLRRTFATNLAALGVPIHVTEKILNHVSGSTGGIVGVYQKFAYWPEQVAAIAAWEGRLKAILATT